MMKAKNSTARMKDVAARCGVAESTVSHVLNRTKFVAPATREKVERALQALHFHRDSQARRLARGHSDFLGLIISDIENPFYPGLIKALETAALAAGFEVLLCTTNYDPQRTDDAFRKMIENKAPGVAVMTSRVDPQMARYLAAHGTASVFLDSGGPGPRKSDLRLDYRPGVRGAIRHLHDLGHRDFALLAGPQDRASHAAYRQIVEAALAEWKLTARVIEGNNDAASGAAAVQRLLAETRLPTAILCSNDVTAMGAARALFQSGRRVPEEVSLVGADDIPFAALTQPPLTTVRMPREHLGCLALELLQELLAKKTARGRAVVVETEAVIRESTGPAMKEGAVPKPRKHGTGSARAARSRPGR